MAERPRTPPRMVHPGNIPNSPITPEQVRKREEARLKAKALREQADAKARTQGEAQVRTTPNGFIAGQKRPHSAVSTLPQSSRDGTRTGATGARVGQGLSRPPVDDTIRPAKKFEKSAYIDYDFSTMQDTKGGFLDAQDDPHNRALHAGTSDDPAADKPPGMTMREWERQVLLKKLRQQRQGPFEPGISVMNKDNASKKCRECGSLEIDWQWADVFDCSVCSSCRDKMPEKYSLLTKTEAREDYLLTDPELKDPELLPWLEKPNPHKTHWHNMQLYLRYQVEAYAFSDKRWGSAEALDAEFERRQVDKKKKKDKKFKARLEELKKRTRVEAYKRQRGLGDVGDDGGDASGGTWGRRDKHDHEWGRPVDDPDTGLTKKRCVECGMEVEELEL